jgi:hypothetical protein
MSKLVEGLDYYIDEQSGLFVLTAHFLLNRGSCCGNGCSHCPYIPSYQRGNTKTEEDT